MTSRPLWIAGLGVLLAACNGASRVRAVDEWQVTTASEIAIANLDQQIAQYGNEAGVAELLLVRAQLLGDYEALDRAVAIAESRFETGDELLQRARARAAVHRFADALADIAAAERVGVRGSEIVGLRAALLVATGRAGDAVAELQIRVLRDPGFGSSSALASAYAAIGRFPDADRMYAAALAALDTTSPFPYAWGYFARGMMWAEQAGDTARGEAFYTRSLAYLPEFVTANVHLAELEAARGDLASSIARLERIAARTDEPEAIALLGELRVRSGDPVAGRREISRARGRYESLLARHPLAFADHAAEFYLGSGADPERAWVLAQQNLAARRTDRSVALATRAALASGRQCQTCPSGAKTVR